jgi:5'-nucleotidase
MRILLTNDDGVASDGIAVLGEVLRGSHEVWTIAPEAERSGSSHSVTLRDSIRVRRIGERTYSCRGTPADCVLVALLGMLPVDFDMVLSGINHGPNLGTDIVYSGTAAAARQGAFMGKPSIALSVNRYAPPFRFQGPSEFVLRNLETFRSLWSPDHFVNLNFPDAAEDADPAADPGCRITFPSRRIYRDRLVSFHAPNSDLFCYIGGLLPDAHSEDGSDCDAVGKDLVSISPIFIHPANHGVEGQYRTAAFR